MRLKLSSLLAAVCMLYGQAFAAPALPAHADIRDSGFVYCVSGQVNTFNPQKVSSGLIVDTLAAQLYDRLLDVDPYTYRLVPELAESWEVLDNGATYRFHLRNNVPFQTTAWFKPTRNFNADDVIFTFGRIFNRDHPWHNVNGSSFPYFDSLQFADSVESVRKLDSHTVEFRLKRPDASFLWHLATHYASVMSAEYAAKLAQNDRQELIDRQPVGTGPFRLEEYRSGQYIRLQRHPAYWRGKPLMPQVVVDLGSGGTGRLSKLLTGECDVLAWPAASQLSILRDDPRLRLTLRPGMNIAWLAFNTAKPPLDNPEVRHALALAINNQRLYSLSDYRFGFNKPALRHHFYRVPRDDALLLRQRLTNFNKLLGLNDGVQPRMLGPVTEQFGDRVGCRHVGELIRFAHIRQVIVIDARYRAGDHLRVQRVGANRRFDRLIVFRERAIV